MPSSRRGVAAPGAKILCWCSTIASTCAWCGGRPVRSGDRGRAERQDPRHQPRSPVLPGRARPGRAPLALPPGEATASEDIRRSPAIELFVERAASASASFKLTDRRRPSPPGSAPRRRTAARDRDGRGLGGECSGRRARCEARKLDQGLAPRRDDGDAATIRRSAPLCSGVTTCFHRPSRRRRAGWRCSPRRLRPGRRRWPSPVTRMGPEQPDLRAPGEPDPKARWSRSNAGMRPATSYRLLETTTAFME